jgi:3',5'-cyclic AMP phosphodiesterase CpdA
MYDMSMHQNHSLAWAIGIFIAIAGIAAIAATQYEPKQVAQPTSTVQSDGLTVLAAGDIAGCQHDNDEATARILDRFDKALVLTLGDNVYDSGKMSEFMSCYEPTWGRHKSRTFPAIGNHDYGVPGGDDYFAYFNRTRPAYYSFSRGEWHFIALDSNCTITSCAVGSEQELWLKTDLQQNSNKECVLAYMHHPRVSSGKHGNDNAVAPLWDALYQAKADLVLSGHDHMYERFAPLAPDGSVDSENGLRSFVVGTGGREFYDFKEIKTGSEVRSNTEYGVLKLDLRPNSYSWKFLPAAGGVFSDTGSAMCHKG